MKNISIVRKSVQRQTDLQVNPLWGILFDLGFVLYSAVIVIGSPACLHVTANSSTRSVTRRTHLMGGKKVISITQFCNLWYLFKIADNLKYDLSISNVKCDFTMWVWLIISLSKDHGALTGTTVWKAICKYHETIIPVGKIWCCRRKPN